MTADSSVEQPSRWRLLKWPSVVVFCLAVFAGVGHSLATRGQLPDIRTGYNGALSSLRAQGNVPIEQLEAALKISVNERHVQHYNLAIALRDAGRNEEAIAQLRTSLGRRPDYAVAHRDLGALLLRLQPTAARRHLQAATKLNPVDGAAWFVLGNSAGMAGQWQQAAAAYNEALRRGHRTAAAHHNFATALLQLGQVQGARDQLRSALTLDPGYERSKRALAALPTSN